MPEETAQAIDLTKLALVDFWRLGDKPNFQVKQKLKLDIEIVGVHPVIILAQDTVFRNAQGEMKMFKQGDFVLLVCTEPPEFYPFCNDLIPYCYFEIVKDA